MSLPKAVESGYSYYVEIDGAHVEDGRLVIADEDPEEV